MAIYGNIENVDAVLLATVTAEAIHIKGADGKDGITPHIGDNGNWYIGSEDTGKPSRGASGTKGSDGTSVTITNVTESTEDGGSNVVEFSDGKTLTVKNGAAGADGTPGKDGAPGAAGPAGAPGTYYGTTQPSSDTHPVWIDPSGDQDDGGLLPVVTAADNGKFLRVVSGAWAAVEISSANGVSF